MDMLLWQPRFGFTFGFQFIWFPWSLETATDGHFGMVTKLEDSIDLAVES